MIDNRHAAAVLISALVVAYFAVLYSRLSPLVDLESEVLQLGWSSGNISKSYGLQLFRGLHTLAKAGQVRHDLRIAVGCNTNLDLIVNATKTLTDLGVLPGELAAQNIADHPEISSKQELIETFSFFFQLQAASERFVGTQELWEDILSHADAQVRKTYRVGGNAALMAQRLASFSGARVLLGGPVGTRLKELLPPQVELATEKEYDSTSNSPDEVHIILEYASGDVWGDNTSRRANRFILQRDLSNARLEGIENMRTAIKNRNFRPHAVIVTGLHNLVGDLNEQTRAERLSAMVEFVGSLPPSVPVHLEMASIGDKQLLKQICLDLLPHVDSVGFNEQELTDIYIATGGTWSTSRNVTMEAMSAKIPIPSVVQHGLLHLLNHTRKSCSAPSDTADVKDKGINFKTENLSGCASQKSLSRIHFHSLTYHMLVESLPRAAEKFRDGLHGLAQGSVQATTQACNIATPDEVNETSIISLSPLSFAIARSEQEKQIIQTISISKPMARWHVKDCHDNTTLREDKTEAKYYHQTSCRFTVVPVLVCAQPVRTVGLGDAISSTALAYAV